MRKIFIGFWCCCLSVAFSLHGAPSYGENLELPEGFKRDLLCDPQTSGGLLVSVEAGSVDEVVKLLSDSGLPSEIIGEIVSITSPTISI